MYVFLKYCQEPRDQDLEKKVFPELLGKDSRLLYVRRDSVLDCGPSCALLQTTVQWKTKGPAEGLSPPVAWRLMVAPSWWSWSPLLAQEAFP